MRCRLNKVRGQFGIIVCREIKKSECVQKAQEDAGKKEEYFIVLEDKDIEKLAKLKIQNKEDGIDEFIEEKFKKLV